MNIQEAFKMSTTVYGGAEPAAHRLVRTYKAWRADGLTASAALAKARTGTARYPSTGFSKFGAPFGSGLRWIEKPEAAGLRFVGFADKVAPRRVDHKGWFTRADGDTDEKLRGAVYQIPARNGRPVYVAGYQEEGFGQEGAAALDLTRLFMGEPGGSHEWYDEGEDAARDAASAADTIAERQAEESREYDEAWQAGARWNDLQEDIGETRQSALALLAEMRPLRKAEAGSPAICGALQSTLRGYLRTIRRAREKCTELADDNRWQAAAFNDGAGSPVIACAA